MKNQKIRYITYGAVIAALYVALSFVAYSFGLSGTAVVQLRLSEALTVLPAFIPAAVPGLAVGCLLTNLLTGAAVWDVVFGTIATLIGALGTLALRKHKWLAPLPPIIANTLILPPILAKVYGGETVPVFILTVGLGEIVCCGLLGDAGQDGVQPVVVVGKAAERGFQTAQNDGQVRVCLLGKSGVDGGAAVGPCAALAAGGILVLRAGGIFATE